MTPAPYVTDNQVTLDAIARLGGTARGVAVVRPEVTDAELKALDAELKAASGKSTDRNTKAHISDLRHRIADAIKGKAGAGDEEG